MEDCIETEVLIIGCGVAGTVAALQLAEAGVAVTLVTRQTRLLRRIPIMPRGDHLSRGR